MGNQIQKAVNSNNSYDCAVYATQGYRRSMEDRNVACLSLPNHSDYAMFGIFDGFNGHYASDYLSQHLLSELDKLDNLDDDNLIISTINTMDDNWFKSNDFEDEKSDTHHRNAGSTIVFALVKQNKSKTQSESEAESEYIVRIFWAGDSRAIALIQNAENNNMFSQNNLTVDHHCDVQNEMKRINNANGNIINNRIDGQVAITRCFGCYTMKNNFNLLQNEQKMIATLECKRIICKTGDIILLFCDGLIAGNWSNERLISNYTNNYTTHSTEKNGLLNCLIYLAEAAVYDGSKDNITVISVQFKDNNIINNNNNNNAKDLLNLYRPALSTGIYGSYMYNKCYEKRKQFELKYVFDDEKMRDIELTDIEKENIMHFEKILSLKHGYNKDLDYLYSDLVRFVIGCKHKLDKAESDFLNLKQLELDYNLNDIKLCEIRNELQKEYYILCGNDLQNNAIIGFRINKFNKVGMNIGVMIKSIHCLIDAITSNINTLRNGIVILFDMKGVKKENMSLDLETIFIKSFQNCYPLRIKQFIILDAPIIVRIGMQIAKAMLSKKLSERIVSVKSTMNGNLWKFVSNESIPKCMNGKFISNMNAWQYVCSKVTNKIDEFILDSDNDEIINDKLIVVREGWIKKRGKVNKSHKKRWFKLFANKKMIYFTQNGANAKIKGDIDLNNMIALNKKNETYIDINTKNRLWELQFETGTDRNAWYNTIMKITHFDDSNNGKDTSN